MVRRVSKARVAAVCFVVLVATAFPATADVLLEVRYPVQDEQTRITVTDDDGNPVSGAAVEVTYRPGSNVSRVATVGESASDGTIQWVPQEAGIATITATWTGADQNEATSSATVSVKFGAPPLGGILIMVVAGLLLIVGSAVRISNLLRSPEPN